MGGLRGVAVGQARRLGLVECALAAVGCGRRVLILPYYLPLTPMPVKAQPKNVLGQELAPCGSDPPTGFYRDGCCRTGPSDVGLHVVCAEMTAEFLAFSRQRGNDLSTPIPAYHFPGLRPGDRWCLCAARWKEAYEAGMAPPVVLQATHISALEFATLEELSQHAVDG